MHTFISIKMTKINITNKEIRKDFMRLTIPQLVGKYNITQNAVSTIRTRLGIRKRPGRPERSCKLFFDEFTENELVNAIEYLVTQYSFPHPPYKLLMKDFLNIYTTKEEILNILEDILTYHPFLPI